MIMISDRMKDVLYYILKIFLMILLIGSSLFILLYFLFFKKKIENTKVTIKPEIKITSINNPGVTDENFKLFVSGIDKLTDMYNKIKKLGIK
jgi:hypothetical protein